MPLAENAPVAGGPLRVGRVEAEYVVVQHAEDVDHRERRPNMPAARPAEHVDDDPAEEGFRGGEFLLCDVPETRKAKTQVVPAGQGDAIVFCTRDRLATVGGTYGLQPVMHGAAPITRGTRVVLGVPFHEYR